MFPVPSPKREIYLRFLRWAIIGRCMPKIIAMRVRAWSSRAWSRSAVAIKRIVTFLREGGNQDASQVRKEITGWAVVIVPVGILCGFGISATFATPPDVIAARFCFSLSAILVFIKIIDYLATKRISRMASMTLAFFLCGAVGAILTGLWHYVNHRVSSPSPINAPASSSGSPTPPATLPPFSVAVGQSFITARRNTVNGFGFASQQGNGYALTPINATMHLRITNLQNVPSQITKYSVEIKTKDDIWVPLVSVNSKGRDLYFLEFGLDKAELSNVIKLDDVLNSSSLKTGDAIRGWAFFEYPEGTELYEFKHVYRVTVTDAAGVTYVSKELALGDDKTNPGGYSAVIQKVGKQVDLSHAKIEYVVTSATAIPSPKSAPKSTSQSNEASGLGFREVSPESLGLKKTPEVFVVDFGTNTSSISAETLKKQVPFEQLLSIYLPGTIPLSMYLDKKGRLRVSTTLFDAAGNIAAKVKDNDFAVVHPGWETNWDDTAFEMVDENKIPIFQIELKPGNLVRIRGFFRTSTGELVVSSDDGMIRNPKPHSVRRSQRIFQYPREGHMHERVPS